MLETPCDALIPAALECQIMAENEARIDCELIVEAADGPMTPEADAILAEVASRSSPTCSPTRAW